MTQEYSHRSQGNQACSGRAENPENDTLWNRGSLVPLLNDTMHVNSAGTISRMRRDPCTLPLLFFHEA
jgi:hypothetical protein